MDLYWLHQGVVEAVDARDALSRVMTSDTPSGRLFGEEHGIPIAALAGAPGNLQSYEWKDEMVAIRVELVEAPANGQS